LKNYTIMDPRYFSPVSLTWNGCHGRFLRICLDRSILNWIVFVFFFSFFTFTTWVCEYVTMYVSCCAVWWNSNQEFRSITKRFRVAFRECELYTYLIVSCSGENSLNYIRLDDTCHPFPEDYEPRIHQEV